MKKIIILMLIALLGWAGNSYADLTATESASIDIATGASSTLIFSSKLSASSILTLGTTTAISSERVFTAGAGLSATDAGAGSTYTINATVTPSSTNTLTNKTLSAASNVIEADTGDSATSFFSAGTIEHERGGLEADISAYTGLVAIAGGSTVEADTIAEFDTALGLTGTPSSSTYLRGDGTWATPAGGGGSGSGNWTIQEEGSDVLSSFSTLNVVGGGITVTDVSGIATLTLAHTSQNIIYVSKNGNDSNDGLSPETAKLTIGGANTASVSGDTIFVYPGTYSETQIALKDGVNLIGADRDSVIITGSMSGASSTVPKGILQPAGDSYIANLTALDTTNPNTEDFTNAINFQTNGQNVIIENVYFDGGYDGLYAPDGKTDIDVIVKNSEIYGDYDAVGFWSSTGSTFNVYNSKLEGRGAVTSRPGRAVACATDGNTGDQTQCNIYWSDLIAYSTSSDDAHCIRSGFFSANAAAADINMYGGTCTVISNASNIGSIADSNASASLTNINIYGVVASITGSGTNYLLYNRAGTFNFYGGYSNTYTVNGTVGFGDIVVATETYDASGWNGDLTVPTKDAVRDKIEVMLLNTTDIFTGILTVSGTVTVDDEAYGAGWNGSTEVPTKNALYDKIETIGGGGGGTDLVVKDKGTNIETTTATIDSISSLIDFTTGGGNTVDIAFDLATFSATNLTQTGTLDMSSATLTIPTTITANGTSFNFGTTAGTVAVLSDIAGGTDTNSVKQLRWTAPSTDYVTVSATLAPLAEESGTNIGFRSALFDQSVEECRPVQFDIPSDVTSGSTVTFTVKWYSEITSGNVVWDFRHNSGVAEGADWDQTLTVETASADAVQGTADQITVTTWTETLSNLGWVAGDFVAAEFCRDGNNGSDNLAGDAEGFIFGIDIPRE